MRRTNRKEKPEDIDEAIDADDPDVLREPAMEVVPNREKTNRRVAELKKAVAARAGKPIVPYPPELAEEYKPYWCELVNSFPKDHFNKSDTTLLKMWCRTAHDVDRLTLAIAEEGEVVLGGRGPVLNPRIKARNVAENLLMTLSTKFRAQPASRTNSTNHKNRQGKADSAAVGAASIDEDEDGLLAGGHVH